MPIVYNGLQSSFVSLAWPWSDTSLPKGSQWECWDPGQGPNMVRPPDLLPPTIWPTHNLTGWYFVTWLVGWPIVAGKLPGWLMSIKQNVKLTPQAQTSCDQVCDYFGHTDLWSDVPPTDTFHGQVWYFFGQDDLLVRCNPPGRDILWLSVLQLWSGWPLVTCTPSHKSGFGSGWHLVRCTPQRHLVAKCDTTSGHCIENLHFIFICWDN